MEEIRLGTIGSGQIVHCILDGVSETQGISLAAVYSRTEQNAKALAEKYGCRATYTDLEAMLADDSINTVYIATPNLLHYGQAKEALLAGKNVICEKPFCTRYDQAGELAGLAKDKKLMIVEAVPTTYLPNFDILRQNLDKIGRIKLVMANYSQYSSRIEKLWAGEIPNIFNPKYAGGALMDINFYNIYLNIALFGTPEDAAYYPNKYNLVRENGFIDTSGTMLMQYDGFVSTSAGAKDTWGVNYFQIEGEKGFIYIKDGSNGIREVRVATKSSDETYNEQGDHTRWYYEIQSLTKLFLSEDYGAVYDRQKITLDTIRVMEEARKAAGIEFPNG